LADDQNPKPEDLECLCKLLSTIGQQLERGGAVKGQAGMTHAQLQARQKDEAAKGRKMMDAYFARIQRLVDNKSLDSRLKFMLMDIQEQKSRGWAVRRKAEGPMKIEVGGWVDGWVGGWVGGYEGVGREGGALHPQREESACRFHHNSILKQSPTYPPPPQQDVHRAARREADNVARNDRGGRGGGPPGRGGSYGDLPRRGSGVDHLRRDELPTAPMKAQLGARTASTEISLRPQGFGGSKGASPMRGAGEKRPPSAAPLRTSSSGAADQLPPTGRSSSSQHVQQQASQQRRSSGGDDDEGSAAGSGRHSEAEAGASGGGAAAVLSETEVHGHLDSIVKLLFGQADDTGETPQALLRAVADSADDVGGALQELLRACLDVRGVPLEERLEKPKVGRVGVGEMGRGRWQGLGPVCQQRCRRVDSPLLLPAHNPLTPPHPFQTPFTNTGIPPVPA